MADEEVDLFIHYDITKHLDVNKAYPPNRIRYQDFPDLMKEARRMHTDLGASNPSGEPRFALLRLWSAPHFYPLMIGYDRRQLMSFIDTQRRAWEFKFLPKDFPESEWTIHYSISTRFERLFRNCRELKDLVTHRGDAVLVAGKDEGELFRNVIAVALTLTTKPWLREIDLWKSYINTDLKGIEQAHEWGWLELGG